MTNILHFNDTMSGEETTEIPLTGTKASLHLPNPPTFPIFDDADGEKKKTSAANITTMYSYRCERHHTHHHHHPTNEDGEDNNEMTLPTLHQGEFVPAPNSRSHQEYPLGLLREDSQANEYSIEAENNVSSFEDDPNNPPDEGVGGDEHRELLLPGDNESEMENKQNNGTAINNGGYATDDDIEEDITVHRGQSQPVFPNPADLKWPEPSYLRMTLPQKYHPFLASSFKKDCRIWLWKNRKGRKAREMLDMSTADEEK